MSNTDRIKKVDLDLEKGLIRKAIDRLHGYIYAFPNDLEFREKLGYVYYNIHYLENAGRYWYLIENKSPAMKESCRIFEESLGKDSSMILKFLKFRGNIDTLRSEYAKFILLKLKNESLGKWVDRNDLDKKPKNSIKGWISKFFIILIILILLISMVTGFIVLRYAIFD